ncbi:MAG: sarcosine oxidase subunit gamma family protein [Gammaproteobacteria bacterium]|nr:sarcosine oxidase subunit gamma family protein [Gammaproteobacteria bacterium]
MRPLPPAARWILRGGADARAAAAAALQTPIPDQACRAAGAGGRAALWLGPDEWLLLAPAADGDVVAAALAGALAATPHSLVDVSHRQVALELTGAQAALLLAVGCPLDLEPAAFPVGMCTRTMLAKAEIVLWRTGPEVFRIEVWRSFAPYVSAFFGEAARGIA